MKRAREELYDAVTGAKLFTVREASRLLSYHPFSVYRLVCQGKLRYRRLGPKTLLFSREDLLRFRERFERRGPAKGKPLPLEDSSAPLLSAAVTYDIDGRRRREDGKTWRQFRWEVIPLIRARLDSQHGRRLKGLRISVRGREGEAWNVVYQAPKV